MLLKMQEKMHGWFAYVLITIVCLSFALWGIQSYLHAGSGGNNVIAKVGSVTITNQDYQKQLSRYRRMYETKKGPLPEAMVPQFQQIVLDRMVKEQAFNTGLRSLGLRYSEQQVTNDIQAIPGLQDDGVFSSQRLAAYLNQSNQSIDQLAQAVGTAFIQRQFQQSVINSSFATPSEVDAFGQWATQRRSYQYVVLDAKTLPVVKPNASVIQAYYKANSKDFVRPEQLKINYLLVSPEAFASRVKITPEQVSNYYQENRDNFRFPSQYHVLTLPAKASVKASLASGKSLSDLSGVTSQWQPYNKLDPTIQSSLAGLTSSSQPEVLQVADHSVWVQVLGKREGAYRPLSDMQERINNQLKSQGASREVAKLEDQLINLTYIHSKFLAPAAKALGLTVKTSDYFPKQGVSKGELSDPAVAQAAWSDSVRLGGLNSNLIHLADGSVMVMRVNAKRSQTSLPLSDVSLRIKKILVTKSREVQASLLSVQLAKLTQVKQLKKRDALLRQHGLSWTSKKAVLRQANVNQTVIRDKAFQMQQGVAQSLVLPSGDSAVVWLRSVDNLKLEQLKSLPEYPAFANEVARQYARLGGLALIGEVVSDVSVHVNAKALRGS